MYPATVQLMDANLAVPLNNKTCSRDLCMAHPSEYNYTTDMFHDHAVSWVRKVAAGPKPFFLYMAYTVPHAGGWEAQKESGQPVPTDLQYANNSWPQVEIDHAGSALCCSLAWFLTHACACSATITYMDAKFGELMAAVSQQGADSNTVTFFASDNGAHNEGGHNHLFFASTGGLRGFKRSWYEGGIRSPSMVRWPGHIQAGSNSSSQWAFCMRLPVSLFCCTCL